MPAIPSKRQIESFETENQTKKKILDTAWKLFEKKGYDSTSVNMIVEKSKVSKGAFYHYFASKTDLLEALSERNNLTTLNTVIPLFEDASVPAIEKLNQWLNASEDWKKKNWDAYYQSSIGMYKDENARLRIALGEMRIRIYKPWISKIIAQGVEEGIFKTDHPEATAETLLWVMNGFGEISSKLLDGLKERPENKKLIEIMMENFFASCDSLLGAPIGSIKRPDPEYTKFLFKVFSK